MQFRGSVEHSLDDRGRVAIPAKWRASFPGNTAVITPAPEGCLQVFPEAEFQRLSEEFASSPATSLLGRRARRLFDAQAFDAELDRLKEIAKNSAQWLAKYQTRLSAETQISSLKLLLRRKV